MVSVDTPSTDLQQLSDFLNRKPDRVTCVKIGVPYIMHYGIRAVSRVIKDFSDTCFIADLKLADIGDIMAIAAREAITHGFSGVVAHAFVGLVGSLARLEQEVHSLGADLILQVTMSHEDAVRTFDRIYGTVKEIINGSNADALVVPANKLNVIKDLRKTFGLKHVILSPGIMMKGVSPGEALCAGADAEVVGRAVFNTRDPPSTVIEILRMQEEYLRAMKDRCYQMT